MGRTVRFGIRLHGRSRDELEIHPSVRAEVGLVRGRRAGRGKIRTPSTVGRSVNNTREVEVVVIGAGQAGLAGAYHLRRTG
ncbi:hypothetical protein, partial [Streptomyces scabiei]|uniref:hypothetical protein n=1 Tax=Streptomyces scabiei TaxID=1930 RepID=UPI00131E0B45